MSKKLNIHQLKLVDVQCVPAAESCEIPPSDFDSSIPKGIQRIRFLHY